RALDNEERVFLAVDGALLKRGEQLWEGDRHWLCAQLAEGVHADRHLGSTDLEADEVRHFSHRTHAGSQVAEAEREKADRTGAQCRELLGEDTAEIAIKGFLQLLVAVPYIGDLLDGEVFAERRLHVDTESGEFDATEAHLLADRTVRTEHCGAEDLH